MAGPMEHAGRSIALVGSCDKGRIDLHIPSSFPFPTPCFSPKAWGPRVWGVGRCTPPEAESGRRERTRRRRGSLARREEQLRFGVVRKVGYSYQTEVRHHTMCSKNTKQSSDSTGSWIKCDGLFFYSQLHVSSKESAKASRNNSQLDSQYFPSVKDAAYF